LIFDVARRFHVRGITKRRPVPHITLAGPFETRDMGRVVNDVESVAKNYSLVNFKLKGFGYFNNPEGKVVYVDIEPSKELEELRGELAQRLMSYAKLQEWDKNMRFSFHATIAFKDIDRKFPKIWRYLQNIEIPKINQYILRITIIRNGSRIACEYDLMLKKWLNRREALSKSLWKKTIFALNIKLFLRRVWTIINRLKGF
jgi:2'-5' RNA ligase